jgi:hypothetical protein
MRNSYKILVGKPEESRPFGRHRRRWDDNIKMNLKGNSVGHCVMDSSGSGKEPVTDCCEHQTCQLFIKGCAQWS